MLVLEKLVGMAKGVAEHAHEVAAGSSSFRVFIGNSSSSRLNVVDNPHVMNSKANLSFTRLEPGRAGLVRVDGQGEMGAALEFCIGDESLLVGMYRSRVRAPSFVIEFAGIGGRKPSDFYRAMPHEFVGAEGFKCCIQGEEFAVFVGHVVQGTHVVVHVLLGPKEDVARLPTAPRELTSRSCLAPGALASGPVLEFADWCRLRSPSNLSRALFILELMAMQAGLDRLDLADQAFAVDVLISGFVASGALDLGRPSLESELQAWNDRRPSGLIEPEGEASVRRPRYDVYHVAGPQVPARDLEAYVDVALLLLKAAGMQCALALRHALRDYCGPGADGGVDAYTNAFSLADGPRWAERRPSAALDTNCLVMAQHLLPERSPDSGGEEGPALSTDEVAGIMAAAQQCIHDAADHTLRRGTLFDSLERAQRDPAIRDSIRYYRTWVPPLRHSFEPAGVEDAVRHESWASEVFAGLDGGRDTDPDFILQSLGHGAPPYKIMSTNSKSGEFFFFSGDRRYLIKTVTEDEAQLLFRMLPAYQAHIHRLPRSLLVRYAGLHRARIPGLGFKHFTVMVSVFDPGRKVHETFDVKGSTLNRRSKAGESIGKDEDWVEARHRLHVPEDLRLELREAHEQDAAFLASFGVMDYSLLIGTHHLGGAGGSSPSSSSSASPTGGRLPCGGLRASVGEDLYFVGLIDFLIAFGLKKQAEHLLRVAQGHAEDASCVDPLSYATRQVKFVQDSVLATPEPSPPRPRCKYGMECYRKNPQHKLEFAHPTDADWDPEAVADRVATGRLGTLRASIASARNLINADFGTDLSDPYVVVALGLQRLRTRTVMDNLDPEWNCTLRLAVDEAHRGLLLDISVWDEDQNRTLQGSDDFLGRLEVPLSRVMQEGPLDVRERLQGVSHGELSLRLEFVPLEP